MVPPMNYNVALVSGRECGECVQCCQVQNIDKTPGPEGFGVLCKHCTGVGCAIYETALLMSAAAFTAAGDNCPPWTRIGGPTVPRVFFIEFQLLNGVTGLSLMLVGNPLKTGRQPWFIDFVANGATQNVPLPDDAARSPGHEGAQSLMNTNPMRRVAVPIRAPPCAREAGSAAQAAAGLSLHALCAEEQRQQCRSVARLSVRRRWLRSCPASCPTLWKAAPAAPAPSCCIVPGIDTSQIQKRTGSVCRHCRDGGCAILLKTGLVPAAIFSAPGCTGRAGPNGGPTCPASSCRRWTS